MASTRYRVRNETKGVDLADQSTRATSMVRRGVGLIGRASLEAGDGLIIQPCNSIVMFFMRFPIDVVFVDGNGSACHLLHSIAPWRMSKIVRQSKFVVELPAGTLLRTGTEVGDKIAVQAV